MTFNLKSCNSTELTTISSPPSASSEMSPTDINQLPPEVLQKILSYLPKEDLTTTSLVNRKFNTATIASANFHEHLAIKKFIQNVVEELDKEGFPEQKNMLSEVFEDLTLQNHASLLDLKSHILNTKCRLVNIVKTLDQLALTNLESHIQRPHFLENIFKLALLEKRVDQAHLIAELDDYSGPQSLDNFFSQESYVPLSH